MPTVTAPAALKPARRNHGAWTSGNLDGPMALTADDAVCQAPDGEISGKDGYREYIGGPWQLNIGIAEIDAAGADESAMLFSCPHTAVTSTVPAAEYPIRLWKIIESRLLFERMSHMPQNTVRRS